MNKLHALIGGLCMSAAHALATESLAPPSFGLTPEETAAIQSSMQLSKQTVDLAVGKNGLPYRRDAHAKSTGCVRARFSVHEDIPERFRFSVFNQPGHTYDAWIRFSNGDPLVRPDKKGDARGMAIKLMGVEGTPIAPEFGDAGTQDFVMANNPVFFNRNVFDYAEDLKYLSKLERTRWFISFIPPRLHPKQLYRAVQTVSSHIKSPLQPTYYSILPYQLGNEVLKFAAKPCPGGPALPKHIDTQQPDYLIQVLSSQLADAGACFDFMVQPKVPGALMPLDDATVKWREQDSPFIPIARIDIPPQRQITSEPQLAFCENLSINPWRATGDWTPLGSLNRARRYVYNAVSKYRHAKNGVTRVEPSDWCVANADEPCSPTQGLIITKPKWPLPRCFDGLFKPVDGQPVASVCPSPDAS